MASQDEIYQLLGKALIDADFRARLSTDPLGAAAGIGMTLTEEQAAAFRASDLSRMALACGYAGRHAEARHGK